MSQTDDLELYPPPPNTLHENSTENKPSEMKKNLKVEDKESMIKSQEVPESENKADETKYDLQRNISAWAINHEKEVESYTASFGFTIFALVCASLNLLALVAIYVLLLVHVRLDGRSNIGIGDQVLFELKNTAGEELEVNDFSFTLDVWGIMATLLIWLMYYILDITHYPKLVFNTYLFIAVLLSFATGLLMTEDFIAAPYIAYFLLVVFSTSGLKVYIFPTVKKTVYLLVLSVEAFLYGVLAIILFVYSAFEYENRWDIKTKTEYHVLLDCEDSQTLQDLPGNSSDAEFEASFVDCNEAFILWASPLIFIAGSILFGGVLFFFYRAEKERSETKQVARLEPTAQIFIWFVLLSIFGLYIAASIASATAALADTILSLSLVSLILVSVIYSAVFGFDYIKSQFKKTSLGVKAIEAGSSDWGKSMLIFSNN
eukprot:snap_masked-scaffold_106-processed-gene-0.11-mRNA-1 protein AED:1.00 eAED:1.00 QI:0/0/0/0/1/1/3/0/430